MMDLPEAVNLARQLEETVSGKKITGVITEFSPHKFAFYYGDPKDYETQLRGKTVSTVLAHGGFVEMHADDTVLLLSSGLILRYHAKGEQYPRKHQLLLEFDDGTAVSASAQIVGEFSCRKEGEYHNRFYDAAISKPSPLSDEFNEAYFTRLISPPELQKLSVKAFLATEQRIPGLGNGVLQDILFNAKIHPKRRMETLNADERENLLYSIKSTLKEMTEQGGRDTDKDLFGIPGGYHTKLSKKALRQPCPVCGGTIVKEAYQGGSIYFCSECQKI
ncbi:MAG TPA: endonuclease VIII [Dehalococcoidia bacterium]|nr:endonuclease VIII [Dehalococcoidia bacterium]